MACNDPQSVGGGEKGRKKQGRDGECWGEKTGGRGSQKKREEEGDGGARCNERKI